MRQRERAIAEQEAKEVEKAFAMEDAHRQRSKTKVRGGAKVGHHEGWSEGGT